MSIEIVMYVLSLSLQIAGAVLLIIKFWGNTHNRIIETYYPGTGIASNDGDDNAILKLCRVRQCAKEIYANRVAFIYIALGYAVSIFGDKQNADNLFLLLSVTGITILFIAAERLVAYLCSKYFYKADMKIPYDKLPDYVNGTMSDKDVEKLFEDTDGNTDNK